MVKENIMKQTEIGLLPEDWEVRKLGELGEVKMCKRIFQHQTSEFGDIPFFKIGTFGKEPDAFITRKLFEDFKNRFSYPKKGEILISAAGTIGRTVIYNGEESYFQDSNIVWIENKEQIISNELLKYILEEIKYNTEGGTIQRLYNSILKNTKFICPPLPEQEAIAEALSDADTWIESLEQLIAKKRLIKQGAMQELLSPKEDWEVRKLGEMTQLITKGTTPTSVGFEFTESGINFIKVESLTKNGTIENDKVAFISERCNDVLSRSQIKDGDILFSIAGALGRVAIVKSEIVPANTNQALGIITLKENTIDKHYLYYFFNKNDFQQMLNTISVTGAQPNLSLQNLNEFEIIFPSLDEQTRIATILSDMDAELEALEGQLGKARKVKQGMMQELLTGRVRLV